ncbi:MAG: carboxypeptidase M32, partial [Gemmobacter sp.]
DATDASALLEGALGLPGALHFALLGLHVARQALAGIDGDAFYNAVNRVEPSLIRVEADELTYDFHIMLRVRLEMALMDGSLRVADLPEAWNAAISEDLGLTVPDDARGCLQDIHWSTGYLGSFPTYTIGNIMAAQIMDHLRRTQPQVTDAAQAGDLAPLLGALRNGIWRHGRSRTRNELLQAMTGQTLTVAPYLDHLRRRFAA